MAQPYRQCAKSQLPVGTGGQVDGAHRDLGGQPEMVGRGSPAGDDGLSPQCRKYKAEQIVTLLRQIEVQMANGKTAPQACKEAGIHTQTDDRWRKEYGGLKLDQAKRLKELEKDNTRLKRLVAELSLEKQVLRDVAQGNF